MPDGGFAVRFMDKGGKYKEVLCAEVTLSFDAWTYTINDGQGPKPFPPLTKIEVVPVDDDYGR